MRRRAAFVAAVLVSGACGGAGSATRTCSGVGPVADGRLRIVTSVAPITDIVRQLVADTPTIVEGVVPPGRDSHTFEPSPATARAVAEADLLVLNGLNLEAPTLDLALANMRSGSVICELGDTVLPEAEFVFDRSFPEAAGSPNPHLWTNPPMVGEYADVLVALLEEADPVHAASYRANLRRFRASVDELDRWVQEMTAAVPADRRVLLTYHDAFAYFAGEYGWEVVGAVQPSSFDEPTPQDVADLIEQVRDRGVPAIFGSEVFPAPVLEQIAAEAGVEYVGDLRDDVLPGAPGDDDHSWQGMMRVNVTRIVESLR